MIINRINKIKDLNNLFFEIDNNINFSNYITPKNITSELQKFKQSSYKYNPQFIYSIDREKISIFISKLQNVSLENTFDRDLYKAKIEIMLKRLNLLMLLGNNTKFTKLCISLYDRPNKKLLNIAKSISIKAFPKVKSETVSSEFIIAKIKERLKERKIDVNIVIKEDDYKVNSLKINQIRNEIVIHKECIKTIDQLNGSLAHEIDTHLFRAKNGKKQKSFIFFLNTANYVQDEEGLATLMTLKAKQNKSMKESAMRYMAIDIALKNDFKTTFEFLKQIYKNDESCFMSTVRLKRGSSNTNLPGAWTKDQYFGWAINIGKRIINEPYIINYLFNGKSDIDTLIKYTEPYDYDIINENDIKEIFTFNGISI